jgi:hypothetical protein
LRLRISQARKKSTKADSSNCITKTSPTEEKTERKIVKKGKRHRWAIGTRAKQDNSIAIYEIYIWCCGLLGNL